MTADDTGALDRPVTLGDGTQVRVRVARPDDESRIVAAFDKPGPMSVYTRFLSFRKELGAAELRRLHALDAASNMTLLATLPDAGGETVIASGSHVAHPAPEGAVVAEVAFLVEEDHQDRGIASLWPEALTGIARAHGIDRPEAEVLSGNAAMLSVFQRCGLPLRLARDAGVTHLRLALAGSQA